MPEYTEENFGHKDDVGEGYDDSNSKGGFPHLKTAGTYGPGFDHEADCEITHWSAPGASSPNGEFATVWHYNEQEPVRDENGVLRFISIGVRIRSEEFGACQKFQNFPVFPGSKSSIPNWLARFGIDPEGYSNTDIIGKKCAVRVGDPYDSKKGMQTGNIYDLLSVEAKADGVPF